MGNTGTGFGKNGRILAITGLFVIAAGVAAYFMYFFPTASQEDATGTIGAVKKYRVQQITEDDVVLAGQEARKSGARPEEFLNDAAKLHNIGTSLGSLAARLEARENADLGKRVRSMSDEIGNVRQAVDNQVLGLEKRIRNMGDAAGSFSRDLANRGNEAELGKLTELSARLGSASQLDARTIGNLAADLESALAALESRKVGSMNLENLAAEMETLQQKLASGAQLESREVEQLNSALQNGISALEAKAKYGSNFLENARGLAQSIQLEASVLANAQEELAAINRLASNSALENSAASGLLKRLASSSSEALSASQTLGKKTIVGMSEQLAAISLEQKLNSRLSLGAMELGKRVANRVDLGKTTELQSRLNSLTAALESSARSYGARSLDAIQKGLEACSNVAESRTLESATLESMGRYMTEARSAVGSFSLEAQTQQRLESNFSTLSNRLESKGAGDGLGRSTKQ